MKKNIKNITLALVAALGLTACVQDLNHKPIDPSVVAEADALALFNKCYGTFGLTGNGNSGDVDGIDEGTSAFYRMMFELNEFPADGGFWNWYNDVGVNEIYSISWTQDNTLVQGLYCRFYFDITLCNHFLELYADSKEADMQQMCAEVRWIRACNYYYLLDMFQDVAFCEKVSKDSPKQIKRADLYAWLETELLDLVNVLPATRANAYRVDAHAAEFLLMRMYLNAEVYTGTAQWQKAADYAAMIMSAYELSPVYRDMFCGDNDPLQNPDACKEFVFSIYQNGQYTQMYGGSRFLVSGSRDAKNLPFGISDSWSCWRSTKTLLNCWFTDEEIVAVKSDAANEKYYDETVIPTMADDDRAIFSQSTISGQEVDVTPMMKNWPKVAGDNGGTFSNSWTICKWTALYHDGTASVNAATEYPDTKIPLLRASEAYLTYAEAVLRGANGSKGTAQDAVMALRNRAHATRSYTASLDNLLDEWQREFYSEGRRRTDLVRFGKFVSEDMLWEGKTGGKDARFNVYPLPAADVTANENLTQYLGY